MASLSRPDQTSEPMDGVPPKRPNNVPVALSSFVGRREAVQTLMATVPTTRLLTLVGMGGAGKTRLAREVASAFLLDHTFDAVWWVDLAPLRQAQDVVPALSSVVGVSAAPGRDVTEAVITALRQQRALLVFDNCEHVIDEVAMLVDRLLREADSTAVLATSREPLTIDGEVAWAVPALGLPTREIATALRADHVAGSEAVQLFLDRAAAVTPRFALTDENARAVADICTRLDGMPLALELAAAVVPVLGVDGLAARLDDALTLLARGKRTSLPRHRTLRAVLDWSYELLTEDARTLLRRLSVFRGSFPLDAIAVVCADPGASVGREHSLVSVLGRLVEHSLVDVREEHGEVRYRLLETVRQYGSALLRDSGEEQRLREQHARWVTHVAVHAEPAMFSPARGRMVQRLQRMHDEIRAALSWALADYGDTRLAVQLAGVLGWYWISGVPWTEARAQVMAVLAANDAEGVPDSARPVAERVWLGRLFYGVEGLSYFAGDTGTLIATCERDLALWESVRADAPMLAAHEQLAMARQDALASQLLGIGRAMRGEGQVAVPCMDRSIAVASASGDRWLLNVMLMRRALVHLYLGNVTAAQADYATSVQALRAMGEWWFLSLALEGMANVSVALGQLSPAMAFARESARVLHREPDRWFVSRSCDTMAWVIASSAEREPLLGHADAGRLAVRLLGAGEALRQSCGAGIIGPDVARDVAMRALLQARVGAEAYALEWERGMTWTLEDIFEVLTHDPLVSRYEPAATTPTVSTRVSDSMLAIGVLGAFRMSTRGAPVPPDLLPTGKQRELLAYLLTHDSVTKDEIGLALWPDATAAQVRNLFHVTLHHVRRALGEHAWIVFEKNRYALRRTIPEVGAMHCDLDAVTQTAAAIRRAVRRSEVVEEMQWHAWRDILVAHGGVFLEGHASEEWADTVRDQVRVAWADGMEGLMQVALHRGHHGDVLAIGAPLLAREPFRESAHRVYMTALAAQGESARALEHFAALERLLQRELGARPSADSRALAERLRRG